MKALKILKILGYVSLTAAVVSCGTSSNSQSLPSSTKVPNSTSSALSTAVQNAIYGNYTGILEQTCTGCGVIDQQSYTLTLGNGNISGNSNTYVAMNLQSNGSAFSNISYQQALSFTPGGQTSPNGETEYVFYTTPGDIPGLSSTPVQLEFDIYLTSANQVDSSLSQINIWDYGYATTYSSTPYPGAAFSGLVK
jgi:hypothetical protein